MTKRIRRDIIDNITDKITMRDVLYSEIPNTQNLDISTGYFNVGGYGMLRDVLENSISQIKMRLLLGKQALISDEVTFEKMAKEISGQDMLPLKNSLDDAELTPQTLSDTASLISLLKNENIQVRLGKSRFNHSKCYIFDESVFIGSSNFTSGGLTGNYELNAGLYQPAISEKTRIWFDHMWNDSKDAKSELISLLESSKFGVPAEPYDVYTKMIFEKYRDLLATPDDADTYEIKNIDLAKFQREAVHTTLFVISEFQGAMIADATGLGKTNMGMEILRQKILRENRKVLLVAPSQVLNSMWKKKLTESGISVRKMITMESLGRENALENWREYKNIDFVIIDESQNFRSKNANRSINLAKIMTFGKAKQTLLLSATPINNSIMDLYYQISIITRRNDSYFWNTIGIPDLYTHMRDAANKEGGLANGLEKIQRLLDGIMIRRTRSYIREVYPKDTINGKPMKFPEHEYSPIHYSLSDLYGNIFAKILEDMNRLTMAPYGLEQYNTEATEEERAKHLVLSHLQVILLLKMFESSIEAAKSSLKKKVKLYEHIQKLARKGKMIKVRDLNQIIAKGNNIINRTDSINDSDDDFEMDDYILEQIQNMKTENLETKYDMDRFRNDLDVDLKILQGLQKELGGITADKKLEAVRDVILNEKALHSESCKVLIFTEYVTTAKYILGELRKIFPNNVIECITGNTKQDARSRFIERFAPKANLSEDQELDDKEIDILISTEVLAEGQNLQDCNYVINYDLPWNPMRIVQRIGRVDRLGSIHDVIHSRACYPDKELDGILQLMGKLLNKINTVNKVIGLDAELLGETPNPLQYNGHIKDRLQVLGEKGSAASDVIKKMEQDSDLIPSNTPLNEIAKRVKEIGIDQLRAMPIGRRSGKIGDKKECILCYVRPKPERRVYFVVYNYEKDEAYVPENEYDAVNKARCLPKEETYLPMIPQKSFEELIRIDKKARVAITQSDDKIRQYAQKGRNTSFEKAQTTLKLIINKAFKEGKIDVKSGTRISDIVNSAELSAWEIDLRNIISTYEYEKNIDVLVRKIEQMGMQIGIDTKRETKFEAINYDEMNLVGAIFITPNKPAKNLDNHI